MQSARVYQQPHGQSFPYRFDDGSSSSSAAAAAALSGTSYNSHHAGSISTPTTALPNSPVVDNFFSFDPASFAAFDEGFLFGAHHQLQPPVPPPPPLLPPGFESMNFFSTGEEDDMLDFLRDIDTADPWEFNPLLPSQMPVYPSSGSVHETIMEEVPPLSALSSNGNMSFMPLHQLGHHHHGMPSASGSMGFDGEHTGYADSVHSSSGTVVPDSQTTPQAHRPSSPTQTYRPNSASSSSYPQRANSIGGATSSSNHQHNNYASSSSPTDTRAKGLLSAPQKRMNHVKSEKRRRDTIRDGYLTLTKMLSPSGPGAEQLAIPRRGRPKGSGKTGNGKKTGKGKSGVLFRAVEYIRFMEDACAQLELECERLERLSLVGPSSVGAVSNAQVVAAFGLGGQSQHQHQQHQQHQSQQQQQHQQQSMGHLSW
ncbi:hypothetical protein FRC19_008723 [Serendipita sp. 401]|nr:hypothetical protein FRC19_008723 [Serendipita sp. 401]KAG9053621.1 hypothetical protein FS842_007670 [Serendipita sp. 407]